MTAACMIALVIALHGAALGAILLVLSTIDRNAADRMRERP